MDFKSVVQYLKHKIGDFKIILTIKRENINYCSIENCICSDSLISEIYFANSFRFLLQPEVVAFTENGKHKIVIHCLNIR